MKLYIVNTTGSYIDYSKSAERPGFSSVRLKKGDIYYFPEQYAESIPKLLTPGESGITKVSSVVEIEERDNYQVDATPSAKKLAGEHGIDLSTVDGTGDEGRILKSDVERHLGIIS